MDEVSESSSSEEGHSEDMIKPLGLLSFLKATALLFQIKFKCFRRSPSAECLLLSLLMVIGQCRVEYVWSEEDEEENTTKAQKHNNNNRVCCAIEISQLFEGPKTTVWLAAGS